MTTLFTTQNFLPDMGGIQAYMTGLADALAARGHAIVVLCDSASTKADIETDRARNYRIERYGGPKAWRRWRKALRAADYLKNRGVGVVVADTWKSLELLPAGLLENRRIVCLAHGAELLPDPTSSKGRRITRCLGKASLIGANSKFTADLVSHLVKDASRIRVLWPGVNVLNASQPDVPAEDHTGCRPRLLTIARLDPYKGIDTVLRTLPKIIEGHPNLLYDVVGSGQDARRLDMLAKDIGVRKHVRFHGSISEAGKIMLLRDCDVFLLPSRREVGEVEGFGIVLAEAGAFSKPAVAGREGGTGDVILAEETGFLVNGGDPAELAAAIVRLVNDPELAHRMGRAARERFLAEFAWDAAVKRFESALYG